MPQAWWMNFHGRTFHQMFDKPWTQCMKSKALRYGHLWICKDGPRLKSKVWGQVKAKRYIVASGWNSWPSSNLSYRHLLGKNLGTRWTHGTWIKKLDKAPGSHSSRGTKRGYIYILLGDDGYLWKYVWCFPCRCSWRCFVQIHRVLIWNLSMIPANMFEKSGNFNFFGLMILYVYMGGLRIFDALFLGDAKVSQGDAGWCTRSNATLHPALECAQLLYIRCLILVFVHIIFLWRIHRRAH